MIRIAVGLQNQSADEAYIILLREKKVEVQARSPST